MASTGADAGGGAVMTTRPRPTLLGVAVVAGALAAAWALAVAAGALPLGNPVTTGLGFGAALVAVMTAVSYAASRLRIDVDGTLVVRSWPGQPTQRVALARLAHVGRGAAGLQDAAARLTLRDDDGSTAFLRPGFWAAEPQVLAAIGEWARRCGADVDEDAEPLLRAAAEDAAAPPALAGEFRRHRLGWLGFTALAVVFIVIFEWLR